MMNNNVEKEKTPSNSDMWASIILARDFKDDNIFGIIHTLPKMDAQRIWIYLTLKTNYDFSKPLTLYIDILGPYDKSTDGIPSRSIGKMNISCHDNDVEDFTGSHRVATETCHGYSKYKQTMIIAQRINLPELPSGEYDCIIFIKSNDNDDDVAILYEDMILDTFHFAISE